MVLLSIALAAALDLRLELTRESLTGSHCRYREYVNGYPTDHYVTMDCGSQAAAFHSGSKAPALRWVGDRLARRVIREDDSLRPFAYDYDAESGALLRRIPLYYEAKPARVFDPNPVAALNNPSLQDQNDSATAVPDAAYTSVDLLDVADSGPLRGPYVSLIDTMAPTIPPPDASGSLLFNRGDSGFEDVSAYVHVDASNRYLQSIGYTGSRAIAPYAIAIDAHASVLDNSFFLPSSSQPGIGALFYGEGGTDDAEDADLVVHEYGHAILEWIAPGTFAGTFASQARAFSEAFGDYWAFSSHYARRASSGRDPFCFADWDTRCGNDDPGERCAYQPGADCLRRLDSAKTMAGYEVVDSAGTEHRNGLIMSSALREMFVALGKPVTDTIVIESVFGAPPQPSFANMARRMIDADRLLYGGAHATTICAAMVSRGIVPVGQCAITPRGEWTDFPSGERGIAIPEADPNGIVSRLTITDTRTIEKLFVRVDIAHPSRGDLRIELIAPDTTIHVLQTVGFDRAADVHVTYGIDATPAFPLDDLRGRSAAGVWTLRVADQRLRDAGTLQSWGLVIQFAGDAPAATRPRNARAQMIPVIGHRFGANDTFFASDLRIANVSSSQQTATLIFTRDGEDGRTSFSAVNVVLARGETVAYDDVLQTVFHTSGIGSLEILGDVIAMSRTYTAGRNGGTVGQSIPPNLETTAQGEPALLVMAFPVSTHRTRLGLVETAGVAATVTFTISLELFFVDIPPYGHVQFPATQFAYELAVITPGARVAAYMTQVDNASGDSIFIPATRHSSVARRLVAPAVDATGVNGNHWRSDLLLYTSLNFAPFEISFFDALQADVVSHTFKGYSFSEGILPQRFGRGGTFGRLLTSLPPFIFATTRIATDLTSQSVPFVDPAGPAEQHLVFIENTEAYRTNIGVVSDVTAVVEVTVYDSEGHDIERRALLVGEGFGQIGVMSRVVNGRAVVRFIAGHGRAYASMIDNVTADAALILGQ